MIYYSDCMCMLSAFRFGFERSTYTVEESAKLVSVCVVADRGDGSEAYISNLTSIDITAIGSIIPTILDENALFFYCIGNIDYESVDHRQVNVSVVHNRVCINITIIDDGDIEENEVFHISLLPVSRTLTSNVAFQVHIRVARITIVDNDCKLMYLKA